MAVQPVATRAWRRTGPSFPGIGLILAWGIAAAASGQEAPPPPPSLDPLPQAVAPPPVPDLELAPQRPDPRPPDADSPPIGEALVEIADKAAAEVVVSVGRSKLFEVRRPLARIFLANPAIANVRFLDQEQASPKLLDIYGLSFGSTTLTLWDEGERSTTLRIRVGIDAKDLEGRLARIFPGADVRVNQIGSQIILDGQVPDAKTMSEVLQVVQATLVGEAASIPLQSGRRVAARPDGVVRAGFQDPSADGAAGVQEGVVAPPVGDQSGADYDLQTPDAQPVVPGPGAAIPSTANQRTTFLSVSPRAGGGLLPPGTIVNRVRVPGPRQVLLKVKIAELNRTALREFGANAQWIVGDNIINSVVGGIGAAQSQIYGIFDSGRFTVFLNALRNNQLARILAEPNLVALDGQPARFIAGGSFPFPVPQAGVNGANVITIEFRDFGAILQFIPHIVADDTIRLDVEPSFSELNYGAGTSVNGTTVPGINQRSARTVVELREGQTLAIAGLLSTRTNGSTQRIPILGDAPVIGPLFSRNRVETTETELVVLVTPELVEGMEPGEVPAAPGDWYLEPNDAEFYMLGRIEGRTGKPFRSTIHELDPFGMMRHVRSEETWVVGPHGHAD